MNGVENTTTKKPAQAAAPRPITEKYPTPIDTKTYDQWLANGGDIVMPKGGYVGVISRQETYIVEHCFDGAMFCTCMAWKFQRLNSRLRSCKHCVAVCGAESERKRIGENSR